MSFWEKSTLVTLAGVILVYGWYGFQVLGLSNGEPMQLADIRGTLLVTVIALVVLLAAAHILIAVIAKHRDGEVGDEGDERDDIIRLRGNVKHDYVLSAGVMITIGFALFDATSFTLVNLLLGSIVLADIIMAVTMLLDYRRGV